MSNPVPQGWRTGSFGDLAKVQNGYAFKSFEFADNGYAAAIRMSNLKLGRIDLSDAKYVNRDVVDGLDQFRVTAGDFLFGMSGSLDNYAWIKQTDGVCYLNQRVGCLRVKSKADPLFTAYCYLSETVKNEIVGLAAGAAQLNISGSQLESITVPIPPLPEQQKIATILSSVDDVIEKTRAQIDKLKDLKTGMMQELLIKGIGHTEFKDSPVGRIPVSWNALSVGDLISSGILESIQDGNHGEKHPKSSDYVPDGIPFVMASDIHGQEIDVSGAHKIPEEIFQGLRIGFSKPGDVLLSHKATIGLTAIVPEHLKRLMLTPQVTYYRVSNKSKLLNHYLHYWFQSSVFQEMITALSAQSTRSYIGIKAQRELIVVMPSDIQEQEQLVDVLHSIDSRLKLVATKLALLIAKKKALMQDLLTGKVRVNITDKESAVV